MPLILALLGLIIGLVLKYAISISKKKLAIVGQAIEDLLSIRKKIALCKKPNLLYSTSCICLIHSSK